MSDLMLDLKAIRARAQRPEEGDSKKSMSRAALSGMLHQMGHKIHENQLARWEERPQDVPYPVLRDWLKCLGTTIQKEEALLAEQEKPLEFKDCYSDLRSRVALLSDHLKQAPTGRNGADYAEAVCLQGSSQRVPGVKQVRALIETLKQKPGVVLSGRFDAGKSTLANFLLGTDLLPTGYRPLTRVATYIYHVDDRPVQAGDNLVLIYGKGFHPFKWKEFSGECQPLYAGGYEVLGSHVSHDAVDSSEVEAAVLFLDSPVLKNCYILDLPGFSNTEDDSQVAFSAARDMDALIYMAPFAGFMDGEDITRLRALLSCLKPVHERVDGVLPLGNLLIVASHADPNKSDEDIQASLDAAAKRLYNDLRETLSESFEGTIGQEDVRSRMMPFWREMASRRDPFVHDFRDVTERVLVHYVDNVLNDYVSGFKKSASKQVKKAISSYERYTESFDEMKAMYETLSGNEGRRKKAVSAKKKETIDLLITISDEHKEKISSDFDSQFSIDSVEKTIREKFSEDRKEAQRSIVPYLSGKVAASSSRFLKSRKGRIEDAINLSLKAYKDFDIEFMGDDEGVAEAIDYESAFIGGLAGAGTLGALAIWAGSLGNLGGYIVTAKVVSALSSVGITVGGVGVANAAIAAIGGPVTLGVIVAVGVGVAVFKLFGASWEERLAKRVVEEARKKKLKGKFLAQIDKYWDETIAAFQEGIAQVEKEYGERMRKMKIQVSNQAETTAQAKEAIDLLKDVQSFMAELPWTPLQPKKDAPH